MRKHHTSLLTISIWQLIFEVKDGWYPLCTFLDVPVPDEPFPRVNSTAEFTKATRIVTALWYGVPLVATSALVGVGVYLASRQGLI